MKNEYLIKHLATVDLSFLKGVKDEVIEFKNKNDIILLKKVKEVEHLENWNNEINDLENFFKVIETKRQPIKLNSYIMINDARKFIDNHLAIVKHNNGNNRYFPYLNRLQQLKIILKSV